MTISRRKFLKNTAIGLGGIGLSQFFKPTILIAQSPSTGAAGQFFINIVLAGGADGLYMFPPTGSLFTTLKNRRSTIMSDLTLPDVQIPGMSSEIGMHPQFNYKPSGISASVAEMVGLGQARVLGRVGMSQMDGSHDSAMATLLTGLGTWTSGSSGHWVARWMDAYAMQPTQVWRLGRQVGFPLTRNGELPITVETLANYQWNDRGAALGGSDEAARSFDIAQRLLDLQQGLPAHGEQLKNALKETIDTADSLWPYRNQAIRSGYTSEPFKDAARVINRKVAAADSSITYIQINLDGFDTHSNIPGALGTEYGYIRLLANNLAILREEIRTTAWAKTAITLSTEFGRKIPTGYETGADHGWANNLLIVGGGLRSGAGALAGDLPLSSQLQNDNTLTTAVDQRQTFWEVLEFLGHNPQLVFSDYTPTRRLGLFSA